MDLEQMAVEWTIEVSRHREKIGVRGRISTSIHDSATEPKELHLVEQTVFYAGKGRGQYNDPLAAAMEWVRKAAKNRRDNGSTGTILVDTTDRNGAVTLVKVTETTVIISRAPLDSPKL